MTRILPILIVDIGAQYGVRSTFAYLDRDLRILARVLIAILSIEVNT